MWIYIQLESVCASMLHLSVNCFNSMIVVWPSHLVSTCLMVGMDSLCHLYSTSTSMETTVFCSINDFSNLHQKLDLDVYFILISDRLETLSGMV